jgi:hypothetical protein
MPALRDAAVSLLSPAVWPCLVVSEIGDGIAARG